MSGAEPGGGPLVGLGRALRARWREFRAWRRLSFTRAGVVFTVGALAVGLAAINTGNNLLYLLLGAMLGIMAVSGWLSEQTIRGIHVVRHTSAGTPIDRPVRIRYEIRNRKSRLTSWALEISEDGLANPAFVPKLRPGDSAAAESSHVFTHRGIYLLGTVTIGTDFPFGLFRKERDVEIPGELVIQPRTDRAVREPGVGAGRRRQMAASVRALAAGPRGEYRGLREYRPGDDPRDIHWRSSARMSTPVVREYDQEAADALRIVLDVGCPSGPESEAAVDVAASLAARALARGAPVGLDAGEAQLPPGIGAGQLDRVLDALARVEFDDPDGPRPTAPPESSVLISTTGPCAPGEWADVLRVGAPPESDVPERTRVDWRRRLRRFLLLEPAPPSHRS